jgi:hypothetical protein
VLLLLMGTGCASGVPAPAPPPPASPPAPPATDPVVELVDGFLGFHLYFNPVYATSMGGVGYESRLPDVSPAGTAARTQAYRDWAQRVEAVDFRALSLDQEMDLRVVLRTSRLAMIEAEEIRPWARNPLFHARIIREGLEPLVGDPGPDDGARLQALAARQRQIPTLLAEARSSLVDPPRLLTQQAIQELEGTLTWLRRDLPSRFASSPEAQPKWEFERSNASTVAEVEGYLTFLREDVLPRSQGPLALGAETVDRLVMAAGLAPDGATLLAEVEGEVARLQRWIEAEVGRMGSDSPAAILARLDAERLPGDSVLPVARGLQGEVREFISRRGILPIPGEDPPVRPFPLTRSAPPILLEQAGRLSTTPSPTLRLDPLWGGRPATRGAVEAGALREGVGGRTVLVETAAWVGREVRLALPAPGEEEGWGLHAAGFLLDQGFRGADPVLRIAQLRDRLAVAARLRAGIRLHRGEWSLDEAVRETNRSTGLGETATRRMVERNIHDPLEGAAVIQALRYEALRDGLLARPLQAGGPLDLATAVTVILAAGLSPDLARDLLLPPPPS